MGESLPGHRRFAPALVTDVPVLLVLLGSSVTAGWAHIAAGIALVVLVYVHVRTRRGRMPRMLRQPRSPRRLAAAASSWLLVVATVAVSATGLLRWAGCLPENAWHGGSGVLLVTVVAGHLWLVRHRLRARLRSAKARDEPTGRPRRRGAGPPGTVRSPDPCIAGHRAPAATPADGPADLCHVG